MEDARSFMLGACAASSSATIIQFSVKPPGRGKAASEQESARGGDMNSALDPR